MQRMAGRSRYQAVVEVFAQSFQSKVTRFESAMLSIVAIQAPVFSQWVVQTDMQVACSRLSSNRFHEDIPADGLIFGSKLRFIALRICGIVRRLDGAGH